MDGHTERSTPAKSRPTPVQVVVLTILGIGVVAHMILGARQIHWTLELILAIAFFGYLGKGIQDIRGRASGVQSVSQLGGAFVLLLFVAIVAFSTLSGLLDRFGLPLYSTPTPIAAHEYVWYYFWQALDVLPVVDARKWLGQDALPVATDAARGLPVVLFRVVIVFGLLGAVKVWWNPAGAALASSNLAIAKQAAQQPVPADEAAPRP
jgi:hypothetical protein